MTVVFDRCYLFILHLFTVIIRKGSIGILKVNNKIIFRILGAKS